VTLIEFDDATEDSGEAARVFRWRVSVTLIEFDDDTEDSREAARIRETIFGQRTVGTLDYAGKGIAGRRRSGLWRTKRS
jgi:hypothetical protein